jgi:hypothetical protein
MEDVESEKREWIEIKEGCQMPESPYEWVWLTIENKTTRQRKVVYGRPGSVYYMLRAIAWMPFEPKPQIFEGGGSINWEDQ